MEKVKASEVVEITEQEHLVAVLVSPSPSMAARTASSPAVDWCRPGASSPSLAIGRSHQEMPLHRRYWPGPDGTACHPPDAGDHPWYPNVT
jgi:antitoxin (DNA-binding transcriptional repressor) of toxin-antitoxin stability system